MNPMLWKSSKLAVNYMMVFRLQHLCPKPLSQSSLALYVILGGVCHQVSAGSFPRIQQCF